MKVRLYDYTEHGEVYRCTCDLAECFPDDDAELRAAVSELSTTGRYWTGGGAAPIVLLMRAT